MPWFKLDDSFAVHPKVLHAGNAATGLWVRCGTYSAQFLLDGHIPSKTVREFGNAREVASLLEVGLWVPCADDDGYLIPDYLEYNPSKEQVLAERAANRERQAKRRRNSHGAYD